MTRTDETEQRILVLAPIGRDAAAVCEVLARVGMASLICPDLAALVAEMGRGAGAALVAEEALFGRASASLMAWVERQAPWSDLPFIILTSRQIRPEVVVWRTDLLDKLRNASLLERPLDALTLSSVSRAAARSRQRQYEVRAYLASRAAAAQTLEQLVASRTRELEAANLALRIQMAERQAAEEALRQSQKMEAVGQLTGGLAHDFNNMLAGISGSLELMHTRLSQGRISELGRYVAVAMTSTERAAALTHRLLAFSRRQTLSPKLTNVAELVCGMAELIRGTIGPAIELDLVREAALWNTRCDPNQLESALLNLVINSRDAMPEGGKLTIDIANANLHPAGGGENVDVVPGEYVVLRVTDTGTGMSADIASRAVDPFFTTKPIGAGTGLGLSMVYGFAKQSAGDLVIESEAGRGSTVRLYLPRHAGSGDKAEERRVPGGHMPRADNGETVLVVDDEPTIRMLVCEVLDELGYIASEAEDASGGLKILRSDQAIDLLITDVGLPNGMNGRQLADAARRERPDLPVLFITGYAENAVMSDDKLEPGMEVMTKPFAIDALATRIRDIMAREGATVGAGAPKH